LEGDGLTVPNVIISFQTGFFWQTILKKETTARAAVNTEDRPPVQPPRP
jgi:hypothetical protein